MKTLKKTFWAVSIAFLLFFGISLAIMNNIKHAKEYVFSGKFYSEEEITVTKDDGSIGTEMKKVISSGKVKVYFSDDSIVRISSYKNGKLQETNEYLYVISDGYLYIDSGSGYSLFGEINAYEIKPSEFDRLTDFQVYECEESKNIKTISVCGVCLGFVFIVANLVIIIKDKLKTKKQNETEVEVVETTEK